MAEMRFQTKFYDSMAFYFNFGTFVLHKLQVAGSKIYFKAVLTPFLLFTIFKWL